MAGLGGVFEKVKKAARGNREKVEKGLNKASDTAKKKTGGKYDEQIDKAKETTSDYLTEEEKGKGDQSGGKASG